MVCGAGERGVCSGGGKLAITGGVEEIAFSAGPTRMTFGPGAGKGGAVLLTAGSVKAAKVLLGA
jgi:hypothetical protein